MKPKRIQRIPLHLQKIGRPPRKVSDADARAIRELLAAGHTQVGLARQFGIARGTVQNIQRYRTHKRA